LPATRKTGNAALTLIAGKPAPTGFRFKPTHIHKAPQKQRFTAASPVGGRPSRWPAGDSPGHGS
jgi:hypothetical protein